MRSLVLALLLWSLAGCRGPGHGADALSWRTLTSARQLSDREPLQVHIQYGAGTLRLAPANGPMLYEMELRYDEDVIAPIAEYDVARRRLDLGVTTVERGRVRMGRRDGSTATIGLTREVPLSLDLAFGAGRAEIDLGGMRLNRVSLSTGASETTIAFSAPNLSTAEAVEIDSGVADLRVTGLGNARAGRIAFQGGVGATVLDFGGEWRRDATASVQMGVGSLTLRLPREQGVRISRTSFLTSFSAPGLERDGNSYVSANWESAPHRLTIDINAAMGSINVQWID